MERNTQRPEVVRIVGGHYTISAIFELEGMKMTKEEATKLALNGYSKADIEALGFTFTESNNPDSNGTESNNPDNNASAAIEALTKTVGELSATVKAMQDANARGARDNGSNGNNTQSASDVVKSFIKSM